MDRLVIRPNGPLEGTVSAGGAKNSALKLMAACLLAEGVHRLHNVPFIEDVQIMSEMLEALGVGVGRDGDVLVVDVPATDRLVPEAPYELVERMRASIVVLGPLLARCGYARLSMPGGDDFGSRPINFHVDGLRDMGTTFVTRHGFIEGTVSALSDRPRLLGTRLVLDYPSHTTTDNLMMAAVLAKGTTVIENAAREPEICDLADYLNTMGAQVRGAGTSRLEIEGVDALEPAEHTVIPDRVVTGTLLAAAALAGGRVVVEDGRFDHMEMYASKLVAMGVEVEQLAEGVCARSTGRLTSVDVATLPYPGVATDYKPMIVAMLSVADGVAIVTENLFEGRFRYVDELRRMGADIRTEGHHAIVRGVPRLSGAQVRSPDIRGGAALVLAGLVAEGETVVTGARHLDRGYEHFEATLRSLGADIERQWSAATEPSSEPAGGRGDPAGLLERARDGDRGALARLLSFVEGGGERSRAVARLAYRAEPPYVVGLTGAPGAGKSTLVDQLVSAIRGGWPAVEADRSGPGTPDEPVGQVAVLAVDPTSPFSGGAILGDRARMQRHATDPSVYIRSMATRGHLGGLALAVPDAVRVLGAAGIPVAVVETVGVGQVEVEVAAASDTTVVVVTPGWGDSLQAAKAGLLEVAEIFVVNKADRPGVTEAARDLRQMLSLGEMGGWMPPIVETVGTTGQGIDELWGAIAAHRSHLAATGQLEERRGARVEQELRKILAALFGERVDRLRTTPAFADALAELRAGTADPYDVAEALLLAAT